MTFEEFFKKKRIDTAALEIAEAGLFSEFRKHFAQMGEKSFDHTKKYWFNKLRRQFPLAPEVKVEKPHIANPLAEQTITESLSEPVPAAVPPPKLGFVPKFKAANMAKPAAEVEQKEETPAPTESPGEPAPAITPSPKLGFTPKFKAANIAKPEAEVEKKQETPAATESLSEPAPAAAPKLGFTPKFRAANPPKPAAEPEKKEETPPAAESNTSEKPEETPAPKPAYKPRFNMKNLPPKG